MENTTREQIKALITESVGANPGRISEIMVELSALYAFVGQQLEDILVFKADRWLEIRQREEIKSDKNAERIWEASSEGKDEIRFRSQLKYLEKHLSSMKFRLKIKEGESFGRF